MQGFVSPARRNMNCCGADPGRSFLATTGAPDQRCTARALHRIRDTALGLLLALSLVGPAHAQSPDTILINGKVVVYDAAPAQALAVRDGKIAAVGNSADI